MIFKTGGARVIFSGEEHISSYRGFDSQHQNIGRKLPVTPDVMPLTSEGTGIHVQHIHIYIQLYYVIVMTAVLIFKNVKYQHIHLKSSTF